MTKRKAKAQDLYCSVWTSVTLLFCLQTALDSFPEISVVTELKKDGETPAFKVRLSGKAYNKKTMKPHKMPNKVPQVRQDDLLVQFTVFLIYVQQMAQCHHFMFLIHSCILLGTEAMVPFPVMLSPTNIWFIYQVSLIKCFKTLLFAFLGVYSGPAENSVVLSVPLFAALQVSHVPHV